MSDSFEAWFVGNESKRSLIPNVSIFLLRPVLFLGNDLPGLSWLLEDVESWLFRDFNEVLLNNRIRDVIAKWGFLKGLGVIGEVGIHSLVVEVDNLVLGSGFV